MGHTHNREQTATLGGPRDCRERARSDHSRHHRPHPWSVDNSTQLGEVGRALLGQGLPCARPRLPRPRGRGRGAARGPFPDRGSHRSRHRRTPRGPRRRAGETTDHHGPLDGRPAHPDPARSRLRVSRSRYRLGARRGHHKVVPISQVIALFPILTHPADRHKETYVDFRNEDRAPLLFIARSEDNLMPPAVNESKAKHYRHTKSVTDYKVFPGRSHYTVGQDGWEEVADYALGWATEYAAAPPAA